MPINFNFSPAGLAAVLAQRAGMNAAEREAIARAQQQQESDRSYQLQQQQQATQYDRDVFDRAMRVEDLHGRLANVYADNRRQDEALKYSKQRDSAELAYRDKTATEQNAIRRDELARKTADDKATADLAATKQAAAEKLARDKMAQQADQFSQGLAAKITWHDQDVAQRDAESQRKTEVAMGKAKVGTVKVDPLQVKRHGQIIDSAKAYYEHAKAALSSYLNQVRSGAVMDSMDATGAKVQQLQTEIDNAANQVKKAHEDYQGYLDGLAAQSAQSAQSALGALPNGMQPFQHGALDTPAQPSPAPSKITATGPNGEKIIWNGTAWERLP